MWRTEFKTLIETLDNHSDRFMSSLNTEIIYQDTCSYMEAETNAIRIPELGIELHAGTFWQLYEDGQFYADWAFVSVNKIGAPMKNYLYVEQGDYYSTLHNYSRIIGFDNLDIDSLTAVFKPIYEPEPFTSMYRRLFNQ